LAPGPLEAGRQPEQGLAILKSSCVVAININKACSPL